MTPAEQEDTSEESTEQAKGMQHMTLLEKPRVVAGPSLQLASSLLPDDLGDHR